MKFKHSFKVLALSSICMGFIPGSAIAEADDLVKLLDNVIARQPEQQTLSGIQELQSANQSLSDSWISGDVDLIIHHENDALTDDNDFKNWQVGVGFPIWLPSQKKAQRHISASYGVELSAQQIYLSWLASNRIRQSVWSYYSSNIEVKAARSALQKIQSLQHKVKQKVLAGESPKIDLLLADKSVLSQKNQLVKKQSALTINKINFQRLTQSLVLPKKIKERPLAPVMLEKHPKMLKLAADLQLSESELQKIKSFRNESPRLFVGAQNEKDRSDETTSLIFEVSIPLGNKAAFSSKVAQQKINIYEKQAILEKTKIQLEQEIFKAQQNLATAKQSINFSKLQYQISQKALAMSEHAYQLGETNIQNLLLVQQQTAEAKLDYELAQARSGQAIAELNQISGHILGEIN